MKKMPIEELIKEARNDKHDSGTYNEPDFDKTIAEFERRLLIVRRKNRRIKYIVSALVIIMAVTTGLLIPVNWVKAFRSDFIRHIIEMRDSIFTMEVLKLL
jgi:hypothetical protein